MKKNYTPIIIGISSGIAAFKVLDLVNLLIKQDYKCHVVMTKNATAIINPENFHILTGEKAFTKLFTKNFNYKNVLIKKKVDHIDLANKAKILVIVPATANIISKLACGMADDFLTTLVLATKAPILLCPSMNSNMWNNTIVQENIKRLNQRGYHILSPDYGDLACGYKGIGRLTNIIAIAKEIKSILNYRNQLKSQKIIVTAGGTNVPIDEVRVITNRSSGKMGLAIAEECYLRGAKVLYVRAKSSVVAQYPIKEKVYETIDELKEIIQNNVKKYNTIFHTSAVTDFIPEKIFKSKINSDKPISIKFKPAVKIIDQIKSWNPQIKLIAFKAVFRKNENEIIKIGKQKIKECQADYIIVNDVGKKDIGFFSDDNEVYLISSRGLNTKINKTSKKKIAQKIIDKIL